MTIGQKFNRCKVSSSIVPGGMTVSVVLGLAVGIGFIVIFGIIFSHSQISRSGNAAATNTIVTIPEGASSDTQKNFEPASVKVVIGTNNTIRWVNHDSVSSSVVANDDNDPDFVAATRDDSGNPTNQSMLNPNGLFEFTFTKPGVYAYHSVPHPWMSGAVIVYPKNWLLTGYVPKEPVISDTQAVAFVEDYLRVRVNNFVGITLYPTSNFSNSTFPRYMNASDFFRLGYHLPLRYYPLNPLDASASFYSIDPIEHKITGKCMDTGCFFRLDSQAMLRGKLVYVLDSAWIHRRDNGEISNLPDGFYVDAYTGDVVLTTFHCPEQRQEWCK